VSVASWNVLEAECLVDEGSSCRAATLKPLVPSFPVVVSSDVVIAMQAYESELEWMNRPLQTWRFLSRACWATFQRADCRVCR